MKQTKVGPIPDERAISSLKLIANAGHHFKIDC
jgi:hypothetical protein